MFPMQGPRVQTLAGELGPHKKTTGPKRVPHRARWLGHRGHGSSLLPAPWARVSLGSPKLGMGAQTPAVPRIPCRPGFCLAVSRADILPLPIISFLVTFGPSSHLSPLIHFYILFFYTFCMLISTCICSGTFLLSSTVVF